MKHSEDETITAIATPLGIGGLGVIRISGERALAILRIIFTPKIRKIVPRRAYFGKIQGRSGVIDTVVAMYMRGPRSYTGEDVVEISCHGGKIVQGEIIDEVIRGGARLAERGEFTKRAFMSGKISLVEAESLIDLIGAKTRRARELSVGQMGGGVSKGIRLIKKGIEDVLIQIEAELDFPEDKIGRRRARSLIVKERERIARLINNNRGTKIFRDGVKVVIIGKPNVGKSSLLNALLEEERAIVYHRPGTTRDTIEEAVDIFGIPFIICDTAGLRKGRGWVEGEGIKRAKEKTEEAEITIKVFDGSRPLDNDDRRIIEEIDGGGEIVALNKCDLGRRIKKIRTRHQAVNISISAKNHVGINKLRRALAKMAGRGKAGAAEEGIFINNRQTQCLERAREGLENAIETINNKGRAPELISLDLREAIKALGEITGEEASAEVINGIFERFCVGK